ncbi:MAG TPA: hypothetical protein VFL31_07020, partial [Nitrospiraceae bacterium]|nr:hypothetical protein [Nitrospiraceae bacterium]
MRSSATSSRLVIALAFALSNLTDPAALLAAVPIEQLTDLTGKAKAVVTLKARDNFSNEFRYDVSIKNDTADPLVADSLVLVLDKITNLAGEDNEPLTHEPILKRMEVVGQDGETPDGKPYFRIPVDQSPDLAPYSQSQPVTVRLRNRDYFIVFTPSFRVLGLRRAPAPPKSVEPPAPPLSPNQAINRL